MANPLGKSFVVAENPTPGPNVVHISGTYVESLSQISPLIFCFGVAQYFCDGLFSLTIQPCTALYSHK
jgi:hypothetical protein